MTSIKTHAHAVEHLNFINSQGYNNKEEVSVYLLLHYIINKLEDIEKKQELTIKFLERLN